MTHRKALSLAKAEAVSGSRRPSAVCLNIPVVRPFEACREGNERTSQFCLFCYNVLFRRQSDTPACALCRALLTGDRGGDLLPCERKSQRALFSEFVSLRKLPWKSLFDFALRLRLRIPAK
uniref:Uncharacterized protein n=1 Tax=Trichuris muris TaxID=70415 RepID=A0A5S6QTR1_TRIMR